MKMTRHALVALCVVIATSCSSGPSAPARHIASLSPTLAGTSRLALVVDGHLTIVDAMTGASTDLSALGTADHPAWSSSGRWLSYWSDGHLWVSQADGSQAHQIGPSSIVASDAAWSPAADRLAAPVDHGLVVVTPDGSVSGTITLAPSCLVSSLAWSLDGRTIAAVCDTRGAVDQLITTGADGGPSTVVALPSSMAAGDTGLRLAGWWPDGQGLLVWTDPQHSASLAADGMQLVSVGLAGGAPHALATMLGYPSWLSWSPDRRQLVLVEGSDRMTWAGKRLTVCDAPTGDCHPLPTPHGTVAIDPAWSPDGSRIAFVRATDASTTDGQPPSWPASRQLWTAKPDGSEASRVGAGLKGVYGPRWSSDGTRLSVVAGDHVVVVDPASGATTALGSGLNGADLEFYGTIDWSALLAWR